MINRKILYIALIISSVIFIAGCETEKISDNATRLRIKLTDATSLVLREFHIDIREISLFVTDSVNTDGEWVQLDYTPDEYDIFKLMNGRTVQLVDQYFPVYKNIEKIRVVLGDNNRIITNTQKPIPLQKSQEIIDGVIIDDIEVELVQNVITSIIIDINAALSVRESNGNYFLNPVARAFPETFGGSIRGYVAPLDANPFIAIVQEKDTLMTFPESDGMFMFLGLNEGPWEIHLIADPVTIYRDTVFTDTVKMGERLELTPKPIRLSFSTPEE